MNPLRGASRSVASHRRAFVSLALGALLALGCSAKTTEVGGETNWLVTCSDGDPCGSGVCVCGVCTEPCSSNGECAGREDAACMPASHGGVEAQCAASNAGQSPGDGLCLPECSRGSDCTDGQRCISGACVFAMSGADDDGQEPEPVPMTRDVPNPTGDCVAETDGSGTEHAPGAGSVYLPDCGLELNREFYRVFVQEDDTAYMIPRPDNHPAFLIQCQQTGTELTETLLRYDLCQKEAFGPAQVEVVNAMDPADALAIAHFLHERLVFVAGENGVYPGPRAEDILEACLSDDGFRNGPLAERCQFEIETQDGDRPSIGWLHTGEQGTALADEMNELYGIVDADLCTRLENDASLSLLRAIDDAPKSCASDDDCVDIAQASQCHDGCGAVVAASDVELVDAMREQIEMEQCSAWERSSCGPHMVPSCIPPPGIACVAGTCGYASSEE